MIVTCRVCGKQFKAAPSAKRKFCSHYAYDDGWPDAARNSLGCWELAIAEMRKRVEQEKRKQEPDPPEQCDE